MNTDGPSYQSRFSFREDDCLLSQVTLLETESYLCTALPVLSSSPSFALMQEENSPGSASGYTDEMMPKCLQTEVDLSVRLANKSYLSHQYNFV